MTIRRIASDARSTSDPRCSDRDAEQWPTGWEHAVKSQLDEKGGDLVWVKKRMWERTECVPDRTLADERAEADAVGRCAVRLEDEGERDEGGSPVRQSRIVARSAQAPDRESVKPR